MFVQLSLLLITVLKKLKYKTSITLMTTMTSAARPSAHLKHRKEILAITKAKTKLSSVAEGIHRLEGNSQVLLLPKH
jgi:ribosomal protein S2